MLLLLFVLQVLLLELEPKLLCWVLVSVKGGNVC